MLSLVLLRAALWRSAGLPAPLFLLALFLALFLALLLALLLALQALLLRAPVSNG